MTRYLADNSVLQRLPRSTEVRAAVSQILETEDELCSCSATLDEFACSSRPPAEHTDAARRLRGSFLYLPMAPTIDQIIIDIRTALFAAGRGRAAGVIDVEIAATAIHHHATAIHHHATVLHSDYDHITAAYTDLSSHWVVPRGIID